MTKYYLAARYSRRNEMEGVRDVLEALGHSVTSTWVQGLHQADPGDVERMMEFAIEDRKDIRRADTMLCFTEIPREPSTNRGGRHVEMGMALAWEKRVIVIGPYENAFTTLAHEHYKDWSRFVMSIARESVK